MKKIIAGVLALTLSLGLCSCGDSKEDKKTAEKTTTKAAQTTAEKSDSDGWDEPMKDKDDDSKDPEKNESQKFEKLLRENGVFDTIESQLDAAAQGDKDAFEKAVDFDAYNKILKQVNPEEYDDLSVSYKQEVLDDFDQICADLDGEFNGIEVTMIDDSEDEGGASVYEFSFIAVGKDSKQIPMRADVGEYNGEWFAAVRPGDQSLDSYDDPQSDNNNDSSEASTAKIGELTREEAEKGINEYLKLAAAGDRDGYMNSVNFDVYGKFVKKGIDSGLETDGGYTYDDIMKETKDDAAKEFDELIKALDGEFNGIEDLEIENEGEQLNAKVYTVEFTALGKGSKKIEVEYGYALIDGELFTAIVNCDTED